MKKIIKNIPVLNSFFIVWSSPVELPDGKFNKNKQYVHQSRYTFKKHNINTKYFNINRGLRSTQLAGAS